VYTTLPLADGTIASTLPLALTDCELRMWEDPVQPLGFGNAQFTMRQAACNTGRNFHIISVMLNGNEILSGIDPCSQKTAEIAQGVYDVTLDVKLDANGDGDFNDKWTVFAPNPNGCDDSTLGPALSSFSPDGCPTIDETQTVHVDLGNISFAPGEHFAFNFVDNGSGQFIPMVYGGGDFQDPIPTANFGPGATCDSRRVPVSATDYAPVVVAGFGFGVPTTTAYECVGTPDNPFGGLGVIAGKSTVQVNFDGNDIPRDPGLDTFCTTLITQFQSTVKAETDYIATLTVKDEVDTHLGLLVYNTNQVINTLLKFAPPDILPAVQTLTDGLIQLNQGLQATNYNTGTLGQENLDKIQDGLANPPDNPAIDAATAELTAWVPANCFGSAGGGEAGPATPVSAVAKFTG
jgi:hypothetical protein